jgi:hypothetical protein
MKSFRFIKRYKSSDWLEVINADTLEEAIALYDYNDSEYEVQEIENRKGCVLALHITPGQAIRKEVKNA